MQFFCFALGFGVCDSSSLRGLKQMPTAENDFNIQYSPVVRFWLRNGLHGHTRVLSVWLISLTTVTRGNHFSNFLT